MVQVDLQIKEVLQLGENMDETKFKALLEQFSKEDFVAYHLEDVKDSGDFDDDYE